MNSSYDGVETAHVPSSQDAPKPGKGFAVTALILGIAAFMVGTNPFLAIPVGAAAVIFGTVARRTGQRAGFAMTGLILGAFSALYSVGFLFFS